MAETPRFDLGVKRVDVAPVKKLDAAPIDVPDFLDEPMPDVPDFDVDGQPTDIEQARIRARYEAQKWQARGEVAAAGATIAGAGYLATKTGLVTAATPFALKYLVGPYAAWKSLPVVDWLARKLDKWGDGLLKANVPVIGTLARTLAGGMDLVKQHIAPEKSLFEYIKKDKDERRKLAEKALKDLRAEEKKLFKKQDDAAKKKSRAEKLSKRFGKEAAELLIEEMEAQEKEEDAPADDLKAA